MIRDPSPFSSGGSIEDRTRERGVERASFIRR